MKTRIVVAQKAQRLPRISTHLMIAETYSAVMNFKKDLILNLDIVACWTVNKLEKKKVIHSSTFISQFQVPRGNSPPTNTTNKYGVPLATKTNQIFGWSEYPVSSTPLPLPFRIPPPPITIILFCTHTYLAQFQLSPPPSMRHTSRVAEHFLPDVTRATVSMEATFITKCDYDLT
jgi:hypothetical protein